jgi:hypothetical protein
MLHNQGATMDYAKRQIIVASGDDGSMNLASQQVTAFAYPMFADIVVPSSKAGLPATLRQVDANNFGPRIGAAYQLPRNLVVRAGYGIMYALEQGNQMVSTQMINIPFIADELSTYNTTPVPTKDMTNFFQPFTAGGFGLGSVTFFDMNPNRRDLYLQQWRAPFPWRPRMWAARAANSRSPRLKTCPFPEPERSRAGVTGLVSEKDTTSTAWVTRLTTRYR